MDGMLKVVVIGDPHFFVEPLGGGQSRSHIRLNADGSFRETHPTTNPWVGLMDLITRHSLTADILVCVGDITTHADVVALESAWLRLQELGSLLGVSHIACATGNHDVASRSSAKNVGANPVRYMSTAVGAFEALKMLNPPYPIVDTSSGTLGRRDLRTKYFGDTLVLLEAPKYRIVVLNSCSEHSTDSYQYERGTFPQSASMALDHAFENLPQEEEKINLLVCHHPPQIHSEYGAGGHDQIENGESLLKTLETQGSWLVIHGHKHHGRIVRASGGGDAPIIFAAASLGAHIDVSQPGIKNQFYTLEIDCSEVGGVRGTVAAWDWYCGIGWSKSPQKNGGIFDGCGFGLTIDERTIASNIDSGISGMSSSWTEVLASQPELRYASPGQLLSVAKHLETRHKIIVDCDEDGRWLELYRSR